MEFYHHYDFFFKICIWTVSSGMIAETREVHRPLASEITNFLVPGPVSKTTCFRPLGQRPQKQQVGSKLHNDKSKSMMPTLYSLSGKCFFFFLFFFWNLTCHNVTGYKWKPLTNYALAKIHDLIKMQNDLHVMTNSMLSMECAQIIFKDRLCYSAHIQSNTSTFYITIFRWSFFYHGLKSCIKLWELNGVMEF